MAKMSLTIPPDSRRGTLIRLDRGRVIVRLDLHNDGKAVADFHCARVLLAGGDQHARAGIGQHSEKGLGVLVRAVLAPQRSEKPQLQIVGFASQTLDYGLVLPFGDREGFECLFGWGHLDCSDSSVLRRADSHEGHAGHDEDGADDRPPRDPFEALQEDVRHDDRHEGIGPGHRGRNHYRHPIERQV